MIFVKMQNLNKEIFYVSHLMKTLLIILFTVLSLLTGCECENSSEQRPSKRELQEMLFKDSMPFLTFHRFECNFENNSDKLNEDKYQVYISTIFSYNEPLYIAYKLNDPWFYKQNGLEALESLAIENIALKKRGMHGLSPVLWKVTDKGKKFRTIMLVNVLKVKKQWLCSSLNAICGDDVEGDPVSFFSSNYLIYGSHEHLMELNKCDIKFPGDNL